MKTIKSIITFFVVALIVIFAIQNAVTVEIVFLFWALAIPRVLLVLGLIAIGFFLGVLFASFNKKRVPNRSTIEPQQNENL
ncbi:MAG: LapA family protein [Candidatus Margulisbacteria bacterium]|nr:LapA family protein [Candidatus Margulisiibacteriota bacterium]